MKHFWKTVWASTLGFIIGSIVLSFLSCFLVMMLLAGSAAVFGSSVPVLQSNSILNIDMSKLIIAEQTLEEDALTGLQMGASGASYEPVRTVGILDAARALEAASVDPNIKCAYIRPDAASDVAHLEEFRAALEKFRSGGKPVIAYMESPTNGGFYLGSVADRIYMSDSHGGMNMLVGLSGKLVFVKDLLDLLGINMQLVRHGKYKSAGEMYIRNNPSKENLEQNEVMVNSIWSEMVKPIAERADMTPERFNSLLDKLALTDAAAFLEYGLVDELVSLGQMKEKLCAMAAVSDYDDIHSISLADYVTLNNLSVDYKIKDCVAIIYADGEIIDGNAEEQVAGKTFAAIADQLRKDDNVKAVVLRVNSPGGSVVAATQIKEAIDALRAEKPVVASYGSYAASGGYWISACSDYIFSDATTLTGSIGVFGLIPEYGQALKKWARINITSVPSNAHSDMYSGLRPLSASELAYTQKDIEAIYTQFTSLVAEGRKMDVEKVDELGQGRVWTGVDALERGLVDRIGTLQDAVEYAASLSGTSIYRTEAFPKPLTTLELLLSQLQPVEEDLVKTLAEGVGSHFYGKTAAGAAKAFFSASKAGEPAVYARMPYVVTLE